MSNNPQHVYLFLTKRPEAIEFETNLNNVWMGVTITAECDKYRIQSMRKNIKANNYFLGFEPLFSEIGTLDLEGIGWVVIGTETGKRKGKINAEKSWVLNIAKQAKAKNIPVFMKGYLVDIVGEENMIQELPKDFRKQIVL
jgi:protein gp37